MTGSLDSCLSPPPQPALHLPREKISQSSTPKDQTSLCVVYTLSKMLSGAIHFRGSRAWGRRKEAGLHGGREERKKAKHAGSPSLTPSLPRMLEPHPKKGLGPHPPLVRSEDSHSWPLPCKCLASSSKASALLLFSWVCLGPFLPLHALGGHLEPLLP